MSQHRKAVDKHCPASSDSSKIETAGQSFLKVLVLGLGNILLSDEGAGIKTIEELSRRYDVPDSVEIIDGGTMGLELLPYFDGPSHVLIVDAVKTGKPPGTIVRIDDPPAYFSSRTSPHQIGLSDVIGTAAIMGHLPRHIVLFGIEPKRLSTSLDLSPDVARHIHRLVDMVVAELKAIGVEVLEKN